MWRRAVYAVAAALILGSLLFPPWVLHTRNLSESQGYGFILDGPSVDYREPAGVIDVQRLAVQLAAILVAAAIALLFLRRESRERVDAIAELTLGNGARLDDSIPPPTSKSYATLYGGRESSRPNRSGQDQPASKWLRGALAALAGVMAVAFVTAVRDIMGLRYSYGLAGPGFLGTVAIFGVWYLTGRAGMVRPVALAILGAVLIGAVGVAVQIAEGSMRPNAEALLDEAPAPNASASGTSPDTSGLNPVDRDLLSDEDIFGPRVTE